MIKGKNEKNQSHPIREKSVKTDLTSKPGEVKNPKNGETVRWDVVEKYRKLIRENRYKIPTDHIADALTSKLFEK